MFTSHYLQQVPFFPSRTITSETHNIYGVGTSNGATEYNSNGIWRWTGRKRSRREFEYQNEDDSKLDDFEHKQMKIESNNFAPQYSYSFSHPLLYGEEQARNLFHNYQREAQEQQQQQQYSLQEQPNATCSQMILHLRNNENPFPRDIGKNRPRTPHKDSYHVQREQYLKRKQFHLQQLQNQLPREQQIQDLADQETYKNFNSLLHELHLEKIKRKM
jgi:hypothetical protein